MIYSSYQSLFSLLCRQLGWSKMKSRGNTSFISLSFNCKLNWKLLYSLTAFQVPCYDNFFQTCSLMLNIQNKIKTKYNKKWNFTEFTKHTWISKLKQFFIAVLQRIVQDIRIFWFLKINKVGRWLSWILYCPNFTSFKLKWFCFYPYCYFHSLC